MGPPTCGFFFFDTGISHLDIGCSEVPVRTKNQTSSPNNCVIRSPSGKCQCFFLILLLYGTGKNVPSGKSKKSDCASI